MHGTNLMLVHLLEQLPVIAPEDYDRRFGSTTARDLVRDHILRLTYTAHDMAPFARRPRLRWPALHLGRGGAPPPAGPPRRPLLPPLRPRQGRRRHMSSVPSPSSAATTKNSSAATAPATSSSPTWTPWPPATPSPTWPSSPSETLASALGVLLLLDDPILCALCGEISLRVVSSRRTRGHSAAYLLPDGGTPK